MADAALIGLIQDQKKSIEYMLGVARRGSVVEDAYDQAFEADTAPSAQPGVSSTLQGFALLFLGVSYLALVIVGCLYAYWFTSSIKNVGLVFASGIGVGLLVMGLLQRYG